jgi:hypothetical protein
MPFHYDVLVHHRPRNNGASWPWTVSSETMSQNKPFFLLSCFSLLFVTKKKSLTKARDLQLAYWRGRADGASSGLRVWEQKTHIPAQNNEVFPSFSAFFYSVDWMRFITSGRAIC